MYPVAILAGGLGTRMAGVVAEGMPKVLVPVAGRPFLDFKLASLAAQGVDRAVLLAGHGAGHIAEYLAGHGAGHVAEPLAAHPAQHLAEPLAAHLPGRRAGHPTDHPAAHPIEHTARHQAEHPAGHGAGHVAEHLAGHPAGRRAGHVADSLAAHPIGHLGRGRVFGMDVGIVLDGPELLGTGGAVRRALPHLGDRFWVTYGDTYLRAPMAAAEEAFNGPGGSGWAGLMTVFENADAWDRSNVRVEGGLVVEYRKGAPAGTFRHIDYGLLLLEASAFEPWPQAEPFDLADVLGRLVGERRLGAFEVAERFYEVGSPEGYVQTSAFLARSGEWERLVRQG